MKFFVAAIFLVAVAVAHAAVSHTTSSDELRFIFNAWVAQHKVSYATAAEIEYRFQVFQDNHKIIVKHNEEAAKGLHTYTLGLNRFADLTHAEFRAKYLGYRRAMNHTTPVVRNTPHSKLVPVASVDWRNEGAVTGVKDQGQCGSCWSFSTTGSIEGAWKLAGNALVSLSEQNLVDCVDGGQFTCDTGGDMQEAFKYVISNGGIDSEDSYPYCTCSGNQCAFDPANVAAKISGFVPVNQGDENDLLKAANVGPVSVAIDASSQNFQFYSGGVFFYDQCSSSQLDHGVLVIGYGTDGGSDYWLVKNSWGSTWGLEGYIMMARNRNNNCGIASDASYPTV